MITLLFMHTDASDSGCRLFFCHASLLPSIAKPTVRPVHNSLQLILNFVPEAHPNNLAWFAWLHSQDEIILAPSSKALKSMQVHWLSQILHQVPNQAVAPWQWHHLLLFLFLSYSGNCYSGTFVTFFYLRCTFPVVRDWSLLLSSLASEDTLKRCITDAINERSTQTPQFSTRLNLMCVCSIVLCT